THPGKAIGVAVSDSPTGPFVDARGSALITNQMTPKGDHSWEDIDPTVFTDDDGTTWIAWGNRQAYIARLKPNMIEIDGPITEITPPHFEEGPWLHKRGDVYYLTYASLDRSTHTDERISYATAPSIQGPWTYRGELTGEGKNSFTIHPGIAEFKGQWYLFLHNAALTIGDQQGALGRRAVTVEYLYYNEDGTMKPVAQTDEGGGAPPQEWRGAAVRRRARHACHAVDGGSAWTARARRPARPGFDRWRAGRACLWQPRAWPRKCGVGSQFYRRGRSQHAPRSLAASRFQAPPDFRPRTR